MNKINLCHEEIIIFVSLSSSASPQWPLWRMRPTSWSSPAGSCSSTSSPWTCSSQRFLQVRWNIPSTCRLCLSITSSFTFSEKWETRGYPQQTPHPRAWWGPLQRGRWRSDDKDIVFGLYWFVCVQAQAPVAPAVSGRDQRTSRRSCRPETRSMALTVRTTFPRYPYLQWSRHSWWRGRACSWCPVIGWLASLRSPG